MAVRNERSSRPHCFVLLFALLFRPINCAEITVLDDNDRGSSTTDERVNVNLRPLVTPDAIDESSSASSLFSSSPTRTRRTRREAKTADGRKEEDLDAFIASVLERHKREPAPQWELEGVGSGHGSYQQNDEINRLLREYPENQEMLRALQSTGFRIFYPVQLRRQESKVGISTRETQPQDPAGNNRYGPKGASRHVPRTSLLIQAFNHKFRLDLELNSQLLAPNLIQKYFLPGGAEQLSKQEIELCYYHGIVRDIPGAVAAINTCNGVSGVIHIGNETMIVHPFYGGDLSHKHPHILFESSKNVPQECGNTVAKTTPPYRPKYSGKKRRRRKRHDSNDDEDSDLEPDEEGEDTHGEHSSETDRRHHKLPHELAFENMLQANKIFDSWQEPPVDGEDPINRSKRESSSDGASEIPSLKSRFLALISPPKLVTGPDVMFSGNSNSLADGDSLLSSSLRASGHDIYRPLGSSGNARNSSNDAYSRQRRDFSTMTKFIETGLVLDKAMFDRRNGSRRQRVVQDAIQIANIADLYFRSVSTRISLTYIETWQDHDMIQVDSKTDIGQTLQKLQLYASQKLYRVPKDTVQLLTGEMHFPNEKTGIARIDSMCTHKSAGVSVDISIYEPHLTASTLAHVIGHTLGMGHDDDRPRGETCECRDWHGCIMMSGIKGQENVQPYKFSECSLQDYVKSMSRRNAVCLRNMPNQVDRLESCGNGVLDENEECDCGAIEHCEEVDPCCDPITCRLKEGSECSKGLCCDNCKLRAKHHLCRPAATECDIPEYCDGISGQCPADIFKKNGQSCEKSEGYCFNGVCPVRDHQCQLIWGSGGRAASDNCYKDFNTRGGQDGNCGRDSRGRFISCRAENVMCGSIQCQGGGRSPIGDLSDDSSRLRSYTTSIQEGENRFECRSVYVDQRKFIHDITVVKDGSKCGDRKICINQTCESIAPYLNPGRCPSNNNALECSGHGVCSNINTCFCDPGWTGNECSERNNMSLPVPTMPPATSSSSPPGASNTTRFSLDFTKNTTKTYAVDHSGTNTVLMVIVLVSVVGGVFIIFALMALCYRRKSTMPRPDLPYPRKSLDKKHLESHRLNSKDEDGLFDSDNRMISFGTMPSYSFPCSPHASFNRSDSATAYHMRDHKLSQLKRHGSHGMLGAAERQHHGSRSYVHHDNEIHAGVHSGTPDSEMVSFIQVGPESLTGSGVPVGAMSTSAAVAAAAAAVAAANARGGASGMAGSMGNLMPEKGILKKQCPLGLGLSGHGDDDAHETQQLLSNGGLGISGMGDMEQEPSLPISEVERTLKSLNGYHEDILQALRNAAHQRAAYGGSSHTLPHGVPSYNPGAMANEQRTGGSSGVSGHSMSSAASEDPMRKSFSDGYPDYGSEFSHNMRASMSTSREKLDSSSGGGGASGGMPNSSASMMMGGGSDDPSSGLGPIRIRNLEDLLRQLEGNASACAGRHLSPNGSEDLRPSSETEADRHYRCQYHLPGLTGSAAVAQTLANMAAMAGNSLHGGGGGGTTSANATLVRPGLISNADTLTGFVYGRYRNPTAAAAAVAASTAEAGGSLHNRLPRRMMMGHHLSGSTASGLAAGQAAMHSQCCARSSGGDSHDFDSTGDELEHSRTGESSSLISNADTLTGFVYGRYRNPTAAAAAVAASTAEAGGSLHNRLPRRMMMGHHLSGSTASGLAAGQAAMHSQCCARSSGGDSHDFDSTGDELEHSRTGESSSDDFLQSRHLHPLMRSASEEALPLAVVTKSGPTVTNSAAHRSSGLVVPGSGGRVAVNGHSNMHYDSSSPEPNPSPTPHGGGAPRYYPSPPSDEAGSESYQESYEVDNVSLPATVSEESAESNRFRGGGGPPPGVVDPDLLIHGGAGGGPGSASVSGGSGSAPTGSSAGTSGSFPEYTH